MVEEEKSVKLRDCGEKMKGSGLDGSFEDMGT